MNKITFIDGITLCIVVLSVGAACGDDRKVSVQLEANRPPVNDVHVINVQAQVRGPQEGLRYKWFSVLGEFDPQDSYLPKTTYMFANTSSRDRVWVEVWRENERVAESSLDVAIEAPEPVPSGRPPVISIAISSIPRYQPEGGPDTRADISGKVSGEVSRDYKVVIYARADAWYIQPTPYAMIPIQPDDTWKSWTHTGSNYAALVVRKDYKPLTRLDVLPQLDRDVLARTIVEGKKE